MSGSGDYISREALLRLIGHRPTTPTTSREDRLISAFISTIEIFPASDVRPVVRGRWIDRDDVYYGWNVWACSACGDEFVLAEGTPDMNDYHYCPNCGAWMEES